MSLDTLYGINGVGKDTVAAEIKSERAHDLQITSASRLSMYLLGITDHFDAQRKVSREQYQQLESVPQSEMIELENGPYREFIGELSSRSDRVLMLSHLVFALHLDQEVTYLKERHVPDWYIAQNDSMIQLTASPVEVLKRRKSDAVNGERDRPSLLDQIVEHQSLCDTEWSRIENGVVLPKNGIHIVDNSVLSETAITVGTILNAK